MYLKQGNLRLHHFAHAPDANCTAGAGESAAHRNAKWAIFTALKTDPLVTELALEHRLNNNIADIYAVIDQQKVAIEVQRSNLSDYTLRSRTLGYHQQGVAVLWVLLGAPEDRFSPPAWQKWLHAAYYGRTYYWLRGATLLPVHHDDYMIEVEWREYYVEGGHGETESAGGYEKKAKRWRTANPGNPVHLHHFRTVRRGEFSAQTMSVPACTLFLDRQKPWW